MEQDIRRNGLVQATWNGNQPPPTSNDIMQQLEPSRHASLAQSPFMARQAERAHMTGLSPIEEMKLAQNELRAKAASQIATEQTRERSSFQSLISTRDVIRKLRNKTRAKVRPSEAIKELEEDLVTAKDMDELTPAEALNFVEAASRNESVIIKKRQAYEDSALPFYIISPNSKFRLRWDVISVLLISYNALSIPFLLAFGTLSSDSWTENFQRFVDAFFMADIIVNFVSAYEESGRIEDRPKVIATRYLKSWFALDLVSAFPIYLVQSSYSRVPQLTRLFRLFRLLRLFRMLTIIRILNRLEYALLLRSTVSSLFKFFLLVCFTSHWLSCFFYLISVGNEDGWVHFQGIGNETLYVKYVTSFYWAIMTMTTVGYGDIHAQSTPERIFAIFAMVLGAWIFAYGITNVVAMVSNLNASDTEFQLKMDELNDYMDARELPTQLRFEIREFFYNARVSAETKLSNEAKILAELSALLRSKIAYAINDSVLSKMPFFVGADHNFLMELALSMRMVCFPPHEEVILEGEIGEEMFFIFRGVVEVLIGDVQVGLLGQKQYFGEMAILNQNCLRTATVRTLCFCELRMLTREKFLIALTHFPNMKLRIAKIVEKRAKKTKQGQQQSRSSVGRVSSSSNLDNLAAKLDEKTAQEIATPTAATTLNRISQLNTNFSGSFRSMAAEAEMETIQNKVARMIERQEKLAIIVESIEERVSEMLRKQRLRAALAGL
ncbi:hypothetical protein Poli38472_000380 [Pythium oligandrum]|uniref:Cyclic nucleotide-binding domain-containing protein n=1 Tax=Pythium oligandrum TaxID=41045 RepID=A0A8K1CCY6_PYTOL|nr:hypothetical protein Poli38472_000380 [Pythium oligandrum]|eukprot:TMW60338.1 hypothetical protein Poli38472_000380 [Pythium oligandrum]